MNKQKIKVFGKNHYLLGIKDGQKYYLEEGHFDCDWYWGIGYIKTFTNNRNPEKSKDTASFSHWDSMFKTCDSFMEYFDECVLTYSHAKYTLYELMQSLYTCRRYSDMLYTGGSHITSNPCRDLIHADAPEYDRLNKVVIPELLNEVYKLLSE